MVHGIWLEILCAFQGRLRENTKTIDGYLIPSCIRGKHFPFGQQAMWIRAWVWKTRPSLFRNGDSGNPRGYIIHFKTTKGCMVHVYVCNVQPGEKIRVLAGSPAIIWLELLASKKTKLKYSCKYDPNKHRKKNPL